MKDIRENAREAGISLDTRLLDLTVGQLAALLDGTTRTNEQDKFLDTNVNELFLSTRTLNSIVANGVFTVRELVKKSRRDLYKFRNLGRRSIDEIEYKLKEYNLHLRED